MVLCVQDTTATRLTQRPFIMKWKEYEVVDSTRCLQKY
jgi:hypothetical protein